MAYLVAAAERRDLGAIRESSPETWRRVRRYNLPIQLALAAAEEVMASSPDPAVAAVISLAPCRPGSADLYRWGHVVTAGMENGSLGDLRMNPTQTLHAVDNLAMSAFAITYGNHADCLGLGGAAGQAWCGLEAVLERLDESRDDSAAVIDEVLLMAGDQDTTEESKRSGHRVVVCRTRARTRRSGVSCAWFALKDRANEGTSVQPHAAAGLSDFVKGNPAAKAGPTLIRCPERANRWCFCREHCRGDFNVSGNNGNISDRRVVITGTGALSALGQTTQELWDGLIANRAGIRTVERLVASGITVTTGGEVDAVPADQMDRDHQIANRAIDDALAAAKRVAANCGFIWSTGLDTFQSCANSFVHRSAGLCFSSLAARFVQPKRMIAAACASGTQAVGEAFRLVRSGRAEACVAGGSSVMLTPFYLIGFAGLQAVATDNGDEASQVCCPFDRRRKGFALADGAGALVVETLRSACARGVEPLAEVVGYGMSQDAFDLNRPSEDGAGAELCMRRALADARIAPPEIDAVNAHDGDLP